MELERNVIYKRIGFIKMKLDNDELVKLYNNVYMLFHKFLFFLNEKSVTGKYFWGTDKSCQEYSNPLLWEAGHIVYFMEYHLLRHLRHEKNTRYNEFNLDIYDSYKIYGEDRYLVVLPNFDKVKKYYLAIHKEIINYLKKSLLDEEYYLFMLSLLHSHMCLESVLFSNQLVYFNFKPSNLEIDIIEETKIRETEFIFINGGILKQGIDIETISNTSNLFTFDNERPSFEASVNSFYVSKTKITNYMFLQFIESGGYRNDELWTSSGIRWRRKKSVKHPLYWKKKNNLWITSFFGIDIPIKKIYNYPIIHISWYEAVAYCKWIGGRLLMEKEWEYLSTNASNTDFPWGNGDDGFKECRLEYDNWICSVNRYNGQNRFGVEQLVGNCWEWCQEAIYPYDGFIIDPVYREISYPYFGYKKICRGGSWATPKILINSKYRNSEYPDCRKQYIGFRVAKDKN